MSSAFVTPILDVEDVIRQVRMFNIEVLFENWFDLIYLNSTTCFNRWIYVVSELKRFSNSKLSLTLKTRFTSKY